MKINRKLVVLFAAALLAAASCATKNDVDALQSQIDELQSSGIASILSELANVDNTLKSLAKAGKGLLAVTADVDGIDASAFRGTRGLSMSLLVKDEKMTINSEYVGARPSRSDFILFEDPAFKEYCVNRVDMNNDGELSPAEGEMFLGLDLSGQQFFSLVGIGMFSNLTYVKLPGNTTIKELDLSSNVNLEEVDIKGCTSLLSCESKPCYWDSVRTKDYIACGATGDDGALNTDMIVNSISTCDAAKWCRSLGVQWYLPSSSEILLVTQHLNEISANISMPTRRWVWTSNEDPGEVANAYNVMLQQGSQTAYSNEKDYSFITYAMMRL